MEILIVMCLGILLGITIFPEKWQKYAGMLQFTFAALLIFTMGLTLGLRENFLQELGQIGFDSLVFAVLPIAASTILVYFLSRRFLSNAKCGETTEGNPQQKMPRGEIFVILLAAVSLTLGVVFSFYVFDEQTSKTLSDFSTIALYLLMFCAGISIGGNKKVFSQVASHKFKILIIPIAITVASVASGLIVPLFMNYDIKSSVAITSGMGWYSLSGIMLTELAGAKIGTIAFLSNLFREILSFVLIPFIAKHLNMFTAIAPAGATSEDSTLPVLIKYTNEEVTVIAVVNGVICSLVVPIILNLLYI